MTEASGVRLRCGPTRAAGRVLACLRCGALVLVPGIGWSVWAGSERLGVIGPCCQSPAEAQLVRDRAEALARAATGNPRDVMQAIAERGGRVTARGYEVVVTPRSARTEADMAVLWVHRLAVLPMLWSRDGTRPADADAKGWPAPVETPGT